MRCCGSLIFTFVHLEPGWTLTQPTLSHANTFRICNGGKWRSQQSAKPSKWKGLLQDIVVITKNNSKHQSDLIISSLTSSSGFRNLLQLCARTSVLVFLKGCYYIVHARGCTMNQTLLNVCKMSNAAHCLSKMFNVDVKHFIHLDSVSSVVFSICIKSGS